ncbi:MAG: hypothetical protein N3A38_13205, partial [Planctomycetota bacterium]|nr:hypothetical protein [Planctomycetota bacterium]
SYTDGPKSGQPIPPTDFDDPNPVTYLSVTGSFLVCVSPDSPGEQGKKWAALALQLLCEALENWGVGGKTSSGYGRMAKEADQKQPPPGMTSAGAPQTKRKAGTPVKVKILGPRPKGKGYRVQEEGRPEGILTLGLERAPQLAEGQIVDVLLHDDARPPQYRWPDPKAGATGGPAGKGGRQ